MRNLPNGFDTYLVNVKTIRKIAQILVAFSGKLNFKQKKISANVLRSVLKKLLQIWVNAMAKLFGTKKSTF